MYNIQKTLATKLPFQSFDPFRRQMGDMTSSFVKYKHSFTERKNKDRRGQGVGYDKGSYHDGAASVSIVFSAHHFAAAEVVASPPVGHNVPSTNLRFIANLMRLPCCNEC
jgi:hypothetical protein